MDAYEKKVDKALSKIEKASGVANRIRIGCWVVVANLFFAAFCAWGVYAGYVGWKLESAGVQVVGTVIGLEESSSADNGCCVYSPVVEFKTTDQKTYSFESGNASYPPAYEVGETVPVLYDPQNPNTAQIDKWTERWLMPIILVPAMILAALLVNFFLIRSMVRNEVID
ncbi:MAG: DUF3592 domain-containing protein [Anaerolineales bacterium]|nr:DUF3592 domain-containing protein [Anaerolineales bacterium]